VEHVEHRKTERPRTTFAKGVFGEVDSHEASTVLQKRVDAVKGGDPSSAEAMLTAQAAALNSLSSNSRSVRGPAWARTWGSWKPTCASR
jgi:hypothetical protein